MLNLISRTKANLSSILKFQAKRFLSVVLVGFLLLTTNIAFGQDRNSLGEKVRERVEQNDAQRPKTVGQWNEEARATEDAPGERIQKIGKESAEALKEFGSGYAEGAQKTADDIGNGVADTQRR